MLPSISCFIGIPHNGVTMTVKILDGGLGRELKRIGAPFSQPNWSADALINAPKYVYQAHQNFIDAGAQIMMTNTYACVPFHLGEKLYNARGAELAALATKIAFELKQEELKKGNELLIAGSIPPACGSYRPDLFEVSLTKKVWADLQKAQQDYIDIWVIETLSSIVELTTAIEVFQHEAKPVFYSFTLDDESKDIPKLRSGELLADAIQHCINNKVSRVMFNCCIPEVVLNAIKCVKSLNSTIEIGAYANAFEPINNTHEANDSISDLRNISEQEYVDFAKSWYEAGATIIGGCCGITPSHIAQLKNAFKD
jgi:S-methylmethionine-dependent homocysteine/selenocysteine methylase